MNRFIIFQYIIEVKTTSFKSRSIGTFFAIYSSLVKLVRILTRKFKNDFSLVFESTFINFHYDRGTVVKILNINQVTVILPYNFHLIRPPLI